MRDCPSCGRINPADAKFCASCGAPLVPACRHCGTELPVEGRFCPSCGTAVPDTGAVSAGSERKIVTVLFADVAGSTGLGERLDPEELQELMATYFTAMREEIEAEGGTVEKFIGDAVMAVFGVPAAHEDDPARALRAALRMLRRLRSVNEQLDRDHDVTLEIRIGINTGEVIATTDPRPGEPIVTGDEVNAAARLETAAPPGEVMAAERTVRAVRGFRVEDVGPLELRGKAEPVRAFRVLGETALLPERGLPGLRAPLVGRDSELELLRSIFQRVEHERRPNLVTIYGDAGVGKSRLAREVLEKLDERAIVLRGRCLPYGEGVTFWPLAEILKRHAGVLDTDPSDIVLERIRKAGRDLLTSEFTPDPDRTTSALAFTVGVGDPEYAFARMDPKDVRVELNEAWRSFFSALATTRPLVILIEDIHWADPALLDLIEELSDRAVGPILFICSSRPELTTRRPTWGGGRRHHASVAIEPLTSDESERLIGFLLAIDDLPNTVRTRILQRAEGNPFFLEEIIRHLMDERLLVRAGDRWRTAAGIEDIEIPDTVQGVLSARIDLLEPGDKRVLQAAAVVGRVFWPGPLRDLLGDVDLRGALDDLEARELVLSKLGSSIAGEPEYSFKHILTREVAYESLPKRDRSPAHAAIAAWIEETTGSRAREFAELLAHHYATAVKESAGPVNDGLRGKAFEHLLEASEETRSRQVLKKAERFAEDALGLAVGDAERALALEALGEACFLASSGDQAWRYFRESAHAQAAAAGPSRDRKVAYLCARAAELPTRWPGSMRVIPEPDEVEPLLELGMAHAPDGDGEERARLQAVRASWPFAFPQLELSREGGEACERAGLAAAEMALRLDRPEIASGALDAAAGFAISLGLYERTLQIEEGRLELAPQLGELEVGDLHSMLAWSNYELGRYAEGLRRAEEGRRAVAGRGTSVEIHIGAWRCVLRFRLGDWEGAVEAFDEVRTLLDERRDDPPYFATHAFVAAAAIRWHRGETVESDRLTDLLRPLATGFSSRLLAWLVTLLVERGELHPAAHLLDNLPSAWRIHAPDVLEARCRFVAVAGAWDEVPALAEEVRAYAAESGAASPPAFLDRLEGQAALAADDPARAAEALSRARAGFERLGARWEKARTDLLLSAAMRVLGEDGGVRRLLEPAIGVFEELGSRQELKTARKLLDQIP